ncbi:chromate transporter [Niameybacter massiliensis]|uniref:Chromate transporter n=1 Tax=Holtiella tumoricola TaxID=3018743 RepID=A0AA42DRH6_9FIRM|nr:chromate transporter [Holtiella tumoricola]MDA3733452.1 chromate transporter [Holtiella tumoricola]
MKELWELFVVFMRMGAFTFGGGYAMLPIIQKEIVEKRNWATNEEIMDYYAIGQMTPGIIAVNTATFIGYKLKGIIGGIVATLGMVTPSLVIITIIAAFFKNFAHYPVVQHAFGGIRLVVIALIIQTVYTMAKKTIHDKLTIALFVVGFILLIVTPISPVWIIVCSAFIGLVASRKKGVE